MEWNVKNALNRNVEREQLNKILKEIKAAIDSKSQVTQADIRKMVEEVVGNTASPTLRSFTVTLTGDATGSGTSRNLSDITIPVTVPSNGIEDSPQDGSPYWRISGQWEAVPSSLLRIQYITEPGLVYYREDGTWLTDEPPKDGKYYARKDGAWEEVQVPTSGGVLPVVTGEIMDGQPVFVYLDDGSLVYTEI